MSPRKSSRRQPPSLCGGIHADDGVDPRDFFGRSARKKGRRKALQLCAQVARTVSLVLAGADEVLGDLLVVSVTPASGSSLLVTLEMRGPPAPSRVEEAMERLRQVRGRLRSEVAASVTRKRVPELTFRLVAAGEARP